MSRPDAGPGAVVLTARDLEKAYGSDPVLKAVSVAIHEGERIGLVGDNGSGKSTLARLLAGQETPDGGVVSRRRDVTVEVLDQEPRFPAGKTVREVVLSGLGPWEVAKRHHDEASAALAQEGGDLEALLAEQAAAAADVERHGGWDVAHKIDAMLGHVGISEPDQRVETLSGGERRRAALAQILVAQPTLAVLDEPSNHLDVDTVAWLERYLLDSFEGAVLLITHDRYLLDRVCSRTWELSRGALKVYDGGYEEYLEGKAERQALSSRTEQNRQNFLRKELEWLRRQPKARTGKQKARIGRAETAKAATPVRRARQVDLSASTSRASKTIVDLIGVSVEIGGRTLVRDLDLTLAKGDRLGIVGPNGCGKTTLLRVLLGELEPSAGRVVRGVRTELAYFSQDKSSLDDHKTVGQNVAGDQGFVMLGDRRIEMVTYLERFGFEPRRQSQPVGSLSGGERSRVALAKLLSSPANVVVLDEPTNDLDVTTLGALEEMLVEYGGTAIVVTHDRYLLNRVATATLVFEGEGKVVRYAGGYDDYVSQRAAARASVRPTEATQAPRPAPVAPSKPPAGVKPLSWAEQKELDGLMDVVDEAEQKVVALEAKLADPDLYTSRGDEASSLIADLEQAREHARERTERWEALEARREATQRG